MTLFPPRGGAHLGGPRRGTSPPAVAITAILLAAITGYSPSIEHTGEADNGLETQVAQPVLPTPTGTGPTLVPARQLVAVPAAGTVTIEPGAFTDRLQITHAALQRGLRPAVRAQLRNAVEVSGFIVLEVRADFYDVTGAYLASADAMYADKEFAAPGATPLVHAPGPHDDTFTVTVTVASDIPLPQTGAGLDRQSLTARARRCCARLARCRVGTRLRRPADRTPLTRTRHMRRGKSARSSSA